MGRVHGSGLSAACAPVGRDAHVRPVREAGGRTAAPAEAGEGQEKEEEEGAGEAGCPAPQLTAHGERRGHHPRPACGHRHRGDARGQPRACVAGGQAPFPEVGSTLAWACPSLLPLWHGAASASCALCTVSRRPLHSCPITCVEFAARAERQAPDQTPSGVWTWWPVSEKGDGCPVHP